MCRLKQMDPSNCDHQTLSAQSYSLGTLGNCWRSCVTYGLPGDRAPRPDVTWLRERVQKCHRVRSRAALGGGAALWNLQTMKMGPRAGIFAISADNLPVGLSTENGSFLFKTDPSRKTDGTMRENQRRKAVTR